MLFPHIGAYAILQLLGEVALVIISIHRGGRELEVTCSGAHREQTMWLHFSPEFPVSKFHVLLTLTHCFSVYVDEMIITLLKTVTMNCIECLL